MEKYSSFLRKYFKWCVVYIITINNCFAYNSERCEKYLDRYLNSTAVIISSSQASSSFGECSLMGNRSKEIEHYFIINYESLKIDASRGHGEYLHGLTTLYSCSDEGAGKIYKYVKLNYSTLFDAHNAETKDGKVLYEKFRQELMNNKRDFLYCII